MQQVKPAIDANNELNYVGIEFLTTNKNGYHIIAEFGDVQIIGSSICFTIL